MDNRDVTPDETLLKCMFPDDQPVNFSIILQNWDKCVFKAEFSDALEHPLPAVVVRLEALNEKPADFATVAAMQEVAATCIPDLVPKTLQVGIAANGQGREFQFSVVEYVEGVTLEGAWEQMSDENRKDVTIAVVEALRKLHSVRLSDGAVQAILGRELGEEGNELLQKTALGGPGTGLLSDGPALLTAYAERVKLKRPFYSMEITTNPKGLVIQSIFEDLGMLKVMNSDMEQ